MLGYAGDSAKRETEGSSYDSCARVRRLLEDDSHLVERVTKRETMWKGTIFEVQKLEVSLPDGSSGRRDILLHHGGAGVCAVREGKICLVRQYRVAVGSMTLEIPAGKLEVGEEPARCAARELAEETGLVAEQLEPVASSLGSPGFSNETTHIFRAWGLSRHKAHPDEGEFVDVVWVPVEEVLAAIRAGLIQDSKTIVAAYDAALRPTR